MDEMDAILALGKIRLIAVEDTVGDILIEVSKTSINARTTDSSVYIKKRGFWYVLLRLTVTYSVVLLDNP
jgi:hypothetical protein